MVLAIFVLPGLYVLYFQNYGHHFVFWPVVVPVALVAVAGIIYSLMRRNYDLLVYFLILFFGAILVGHLVRLAFFPVIIVD
jgi:asparagine N-glycosylation enzyme membrane subunit Stt3